jgi:hypothetical protein
VLYLIDSGFPGFGYKTKGGCTLWSDMVKKPTPGFGYKTKGGCTLLVFKNYHLFGMPNTKQ